MNCPYCSNEETKVIDSRESKEGTHIKRRRECLKCQKRFSTIEKIQKLDLEVLKSDSRVEEFNIDKLRKSLLRSCEKRPVTLEQIDEILTNTFEDLKLIEETPVPTKLVAKFVLKHLKSVDEMAFLKFAIVHNNYETMNEFVKEIKHLKKY